MCLTGGIASGKTYVSDRFQALGACVIDADILAREVVQKESKGLGLIVKEFGLGVLHPDGTLNRGGLKKRVFGNQSKLHTLNSILHPLIKELFLQKSAMNRKNIEIWVIPLLTAKSGYKDFNRTLAIDVDEAVQLDRVIQRDQIPVEIAQSIIESQPSRRTRLQLATDIIRNNKDLNELDKAVELFYKMVSALNI